MKLIAVLWLTLLLPALAVAQEVEREAIPEGLRDDPALEEQQAEEDAQVRGLLTVDGTEVDLDSLRWESRLVVILAESPNHPDFRRQLAFLEERAEEMIERDVIVVVDTDPNSNSEVRRMLRPRGFMLAIIGKDGEVKQRKPSPWSAREIAHAIDKFPLRREEMLDSRPSGRD